MIRRTLRRRQSRTPLQSPHQAQAALEQEVREPADSRSRITPKTEKLDLTPAELPIASLAQCIEDYLLDCRYRCNSAQTLQTRRILLGHFQWFLNEYDHSHCSPRAIKAFLLYLRQEHDADGGRWGQARLNGPLHPRTVKDYCTALNAFFNWLVEDEALEVSPLAKIPIPTSQSEQVRPFTPQQVLLLIKAAKKSLQPLRNETLIWFLIDTGVRASELCGLKMQDLDMQERRCLVLGKGHKRRHVYFGRNTSRALRHYLRHQHREPDSPVFTNERDMEKEEPLTRSGLLQIINKLGKTAGLQAVRCSPHTFRHTFAVEFLRAGGNQFSLKELLGHATLHMTNRYIALAQADVQAQHRQFSPGDRLGNAD